MLNGGIFPLEVYNMMSIYEVKAKIAQQRKYFMKDIRLVYQGKQIFDGTIESNGVKVD